MYSSCIILTIIGAAVAGYAGNSYSGSFSGSGPGPGNIPIPPIPDFSGYFDELARYHTTFLAKGGGAISYSYTSGSPSSKVEASSSITFSRYPGLQKNIGANVANIAQMHAAGAAGIPGASGAFASGSIGPGGGHQTAGVYPQNPNQPNIQTRFGAPPSGDGSYGVFSSSFSSSSDVNGQPTSFHKAQTTVNDNGKITTYTVQNP